MIEFNEIYKNEIIKVLLEDEDEISEEVYARVINNNGSNLYVNYLTSTNMFYKDAVIYKFEDEQNILETFESICEHYPDNYNLCHFGFEEIEDDLFVRESDIDSEDSDSDIHDYSSEDNNSFIAPEDTDQWELPPDHSVVDSDWNKWVPKSEGERRYKDMVDKIDMITKVLQGIIVAMSGYLVYRIMANRSKQEETIKRRT